jgi:hypothetical protein
MTKLYIIVIIKKYAIEKMTINVKNVKKIKRLLNLFNSNTI